MTFALLLESQPFFLSILAAFGLVIGSFLNVVIYRLPKMMQADWQQECAAYLDQPPPENIEPMTLATPNSQCPACARPIRALENIPVVSFLLLGGRCRGCQAAISWRYPTIELFTALLFVYAGYRFGPTIQLCGALIVISVLIALTGIDADTQMLPDSLTLPLLWIGLLLNSGVGLFTDLQSAVFGAAAGYGVLWSVFWLFKLITGKEGMGYGDFKLLAALGAWFGWQALPLIILLSSVVGTIFGISRMLLLRQYRDAPMAFGPFLALAGVLTLFWRDGLELVLGIVSVY
jgi:leader peptidase (prepilin peptidase)/N-methyltransferase